jgi:hypothetical protein
MVQPRVRVAANESPDKQDRPALSREWHAALQANDPTVTTEPRMVSLGSSKFARSDRSYTLELLLGEERGDGHPCPIARSTSRLTRNADDAAGNRSVDQQLAMVIEAPRGTPGRTVRANRGRSTRPACGTALSPGPLAVQPGWPTSSPQDKGRLTCHSVGSCPQPAPSAVTGPGQAGAA